MDYWDTSALLKLYAPEPDSASFLTHVAKSQRPLLTADLTAVELRCALQRKEHVGDLKAGGATALFERFTYDVAAGRIIPVPYGPAVLAEVQELVMHAYSADPPVMIRSLDAVHVASALASRAAWVIATDARLRDAAITVGLRVAP